MTNRNTPNLKSPLGFMKANDGKDHINIHSMGKVEIGRLLSHFSHTPFTHPAYGPFYSMEGFYYYLRSGAVDATAGHMRYLSGYRAKRKGTMLKYIANANFEQEIMAANYQKIIQHPDILKLFVGSELPFDHYYTFGNNDQIIAPKNADWLIEGFEAIRRAMKADTVPECWIAVEERHDL